MPRRWTAVTIASFLIFFGFTPHAQAVSGEPAVAKLWFGTFNIYGNLGHHGDTDWWPHGGMENEVSTYLNRDFTALALQEVCRNQGERFAYLTKMNMTFMAGNRKCSNGADYGNAVLHKAPASGEPVMRRLPPISGPGGEVEQRVLLCVPLREGLPVQVLFCSIHLSLEAEYRKEQLDWIEAKEVNPLYPPGSQEDWPLWSWGTVVMGGDFNAAPFHPEMSSMYNGIGATEAAGPRGSVGQTHDTQGKIDYLFTWDRRGFGQWKEFTIAPTPNSDHHHYQARLDIQYCDPAPPCTFPAQDGSR